MQRYVPDAQDPRHLFAALHRQLGNLVAERTRLVQWMQQALDQMNVLVHRAVTDLTGETVMRIVREIVAGERDPRKLAALRHGRCKKETEFEACLTGTWREEHLFNLAEVLRMYDAVQERIDACERRLLEEMEALQPEERREAEPPHPNPQKERALKKNGQFDERTAMWRMTGVDLIAGSSRCRIAPPRA